MIIKITGLIWIKQPERLMMSNETSHNNIVMADDELFKAHLFELAKQFGSDNVLNIFPDFLHFKLGHDMSAVAANCTNQGVKVFVRVGIDFNGMVAALRARNRD